MEFDCVQSCSIDDLFGACARFSIEAQNNSRQALESAAYGVLLGRYLHRELVKFVLIQLRNTEEICVRLGLEDMDHNVLIAHLASGLSDHALSIAVVHILDTQHPFVLAQLCNYASPDDAPTPLEMILELMLVWDVCIRIPMKTRWLGSGARRTRTEFVLRQWFPQLQTSAEQRPAASKRTLPDNESELPPARYICALPDLSSQTRGVCALIAPPPVFVSDPRVPCRIFLNEADVKPSLLTVSDETGLLHQTARDCILQDVYENAASEVRSRSRTNHDIGERLRSEHERLAQEPVSTSAPVSVRRIPAAKPSSVRQKLRSVLPQTVRDQRAMVQQLQAKYQGAKPFVCCLYGMLEDSEAQGVIEWNNAGTQFYVVSVSKLERLLPHYFQHNQLKGLRKMLSKFGFTNYKADSITYYSHPYFMRDQPQLLRFCQRRAEQERYNQMAAAMLKSERSRNASAHAAAASALVTSSSKVVKKSSRKAVSSDDTDDESEGDSSSTTTSTDDDRPLSQVLMETPRQPKSFELYSSLPTAPLKKFDTGDETARRSKRHTTQIDYYERR
eukprot:TRINITY_DN940_c0_g1_i1.p2 TRINITY_DN940_c0_g1~~TRINITY_DN940_c0_g1_i1.p2  ORF type:complete len:560 (-),score=91.09 TRINITY_DN940_c0_g1_i1:196-1875(-)